MSFTITKSILIVTAIFSFFQAPVSASSPHVINFRSPNLYPESLAYDPTAQHFIVGSLNHPTLLAISDAGVVNTLVNDQSLPDTSSFLGVTVDIFHHRLLAVVYNRSDPSNGALAAYDSRAPHTRLFLTTLHDPASSPTAAGANDVTVDFSGNAFVTNSASNLIWKVDRDGKASVLSKSKVFNKTAAVPDMLHSSCGLNGIAYCTKGYLLVAQSNTGNLYKVDDEDGTARKIRLNRELTAPDGIALRRDGVLLVVSQHKLYFIKSDDSWSEGVVYDETALDSESFATSVTVGAEDRVYVLYGHLKEGILGNSQRDQFSILEVRSEDESAGEAVWVYVLIGFGLIYFLIWRFQMRQLFTNMNKKIA
ncbi:putative transcription factor WD40-like family [Helianthus annuus]|nr:putative transcription factor WD40-like family [Helianthus annuus]KAJ0864210.1 putative transcription factor WD40-like family [Helianthus annuus]